MNTSAALLCFYDTIFGGFVPLAHFALLVGTTMLPFLL